MKTIVIYILLFMVTVLLFNCKKYPEGGCERRGPKNIIGNWKLSLYEVNGIDSTELINYNGNDVYKTIKIYKNVSVIQIDQKSSITNSANFGDKNKTLTISRQSQSNGQVCYLDNNINYCYRLFFTPENNRSMVWEILKITKDEIILSSSSGKSYKIKLLHS